MRYLQSASDGGNSYGQARLGRAYRSGGGVEKNQAKAIEYCEKAVARGNALGQVWFGWILESGERVPKKRCGTEKGNWLGQFFCGRVLKKGRGTEKDVIIAAQYFKGGADQGHADCEYEFGLCLEEGIGVSRIGERQ
jgi:TPR repeat protein